MNAAESASGLDRNMGKAARPVKSPPAERRSDHRNRAATRSDLPTTIGCVFVIALPEASGPFRQIEWPVAARPSPEPPPSDHGDSAGAGRYIATMSADLAAIARRHGLDTLAYLLDMARLEAEIVARQGCSAPER